MDSIRTPKTLRPGCLGFLTPTEVTVPLLPAHPSAKTGINFNPTTNAMARVWGRLTAFGGVLCCLIGWGLSPAWAQGQPQLNLARVNIAAGFYQIDAQVAQTPEQREIGLMFRQTMPQHEGMVFVFEEPATQCFWMKNTHLALSTAFVADNGEIVNIEDMKPYSTNSHCSSLPVRFVLEMQQGWFAKKNIKAGFKLSAPLFR